MGKSKKRKLSNKIVYYDDNDIDNNNDNDNNDKADDVSTDLDLSIKLLHAINQFNTFNSKNLKEVRRSLYSLIIKQQHHHFEVDNNNYTADDDTIINETNINKLIKLANYLNNNEKEFLGIKYKNFRKALHPFVLKHRNPNNNNNNNNSNINLSNQITEAFRNRKWIETLILLRRMRFSPNKDDMPKLGALQRWVRDCDVANRLNNNDNSAISYTSTENVTSDNNRNKNTSILLLDAILRVMVNKQDLLMNNNNSKNSNNNNSNGNGNNNNDNNDDITSNIIDKKATIVRHPPYVFPSYTTTISNENNYDYIDLTGKLRIVHTTKGDQRKPPSKTDLNIYMTSPNIVNFNENNNDKPDPTRHDIPHVPGAFLISKVLTVLECKQLITIAEKIGYIPDAVDGIDNIQWLADETLVNPIFERCKKLIPETINGKKLASINARWRLFRYTPGAVYRPHIDGSWPGSGLCKDGKFSDEIFKDRHSKLTFLIYLNGDFDGGETTFFMANEQEEFSVNAYRVQPSTGSILCFPHGETLFSLIHEGSEVKQGSSKYVIRSDVLYYI